MMLNSKSIGDKIATARKKTNLSQAELALQVSISSQAVGKWERGESLPDIRTLIRLAEIFGVDLNYFSETFKSNGITDLIEKQSVGILTSKPKKNSGQNWDMSVGNWVNAEFSGIKNLKEKFSCSNIKNCKFLNSEFSDLIFECNNIENSDFSDSDLRNTKIQGSTVSKNNFTNCLLIDAEFEVCEINNCNFSGANFSGVEFRTADFRNNKIENAVWKSTTFETSVLVNLIFDGLMEDCIFEHCSFSKVTFSGATLKNTFFKCKSLKNITFKESRADRMTYEFLKNGKANLTGLILIS